MKPSAGNRTVVVDFSARGSDNRWGACLKHVWPVEDAECFDDLLRAIDDAAGGSPRALDEDPRNLPARRD